MRLSPTWAMKPRSPAMSRPTWSSPSRASRARPGPAGRSAWPAVCTACSSSVRTSCGLDVGVALGEALDQVASRVDRACETRAPRCAKRPRPRRGRPCRRRPRTATSFLSTRKLSSFASRLRPTSVAAQKVNSMRGWLHAVGPSASAVIGCYHETHPAEGGDSRHVGEDRGPAPAPDGPRTRIRAYDLTREPALLDMWPLFPPRRRAWSLGDRLMAGRQTLDLAIKVRILVPELNGGYSPTLRPHGLAVRTAPSHGAISGSIPDGVTLKVVESRQRFRSASFLLPCCCHGG